MVDVGPHRRLGRAVTTHVSDIEKFIRKEHDMNVKIGSIVTACCIGISFLHGGLLHTVRCFIAPGLYAAQSPPNIIDHTKRDIAKIPVQAIVQAKKKLHIAYGHTSHGQQLVVGMESLDSFMSKKGYASGTFAVDFDGRPSGSELDLCDNPWKNWSEYGRDLGSRKTDGKMSDGDYTAWVYTTRKYLGWAPGSGDGSQLAHYATGAPRYNPSSCNNCNVIVWAWCGQVGYCPPQEIHNYLRNMTQLERAYPQVKFVYMTGHLARGEQKHDIGLNGSVHTRNTIIRNYCIKNNKILYDFEDIESYDPDGVYYGNRFATDSCNYDANNDGVTTENLDGGNWSLPFIAAHGDRNWALDWQKKHKEGSDWFTTRAQPQHTHYINANMKAFAAWRLWIYCARWSGY